MTGWSIEQARDCYSIAHWGSGYFDINEAGDLVAYPDTNADASGVDLFRLTAEIQAAGLSLPVLVRFADILHHRVDTLCNAFDASMAQRAYVGRFSAVYPIKVNQQRCVVEEIIAHGRDRVGLEAGSKPELLAVLALSHQQGGIIVCNGYKDREYVRLALIGTRIGQRVYIVVEELSELELIIEEARRLDVEPLIGVRVRLASIGAGMWQNTGGDKSKFGLSAAEVLRVVDRLRDAGMLDALAMLHFHIGSQVANIRDIQAAMREAARYYAELRHQGAEVQCVDVGGGLGVDYEGTHSRRFCSINYSVAEYAGNVVHALAEICQQEELPQPDIISESGRALTAHHAVLITNVIEVERMAGEAVLARPPATEPAVIHDLWNGLDKISSRSAIETYHEAEHWLAEAQVMFTHGVLNLEQRARAEQLYYATCLEVCKAMSGRSRMQQAIMDEIKEKLADKYFCNFSLFQSLPDAWGIGQVFPIVPLHRLGERPTRRGVVVDVTCDSDGRIDQYVESSGVEPTLPLHPVRDGEPYLIGMFMVGAYQEILGDMHNLFGDTNSVNVIMDGAGGYRLVSPRRGDTVDAVLRHVDFDAGDLLDKLHEKLEGCALAAEQRAAYLSELAAGLEGYTYLED